MAVYVYTNHLQIGDYGYPAIHVGADIFITLIGHPGPPVGPDIPILECFMAATGEKALVRTGLVEYAFSGEILKVRNRPLRCGATLFQALVDSKVPFIFSYLGSPKIQVMDLQSYSSEEPIRGRYLSGLVSLHGIIAFRYGELIDHSMQARVVSLEELELRPAAKGLGATRQVQTVDSYAAKQPVILGLEFDR